jgi:hypothetical protein
MTGAAVAPPDRAAIARVLAVQVLLAGGASCLLALAWTGDAPPRIALAVAAAGYVVHALWAFLSWRRVTGRLVDGYSLFLLALLLFNGGHLMLGPFGLLRDGILDGTIDMRTLARSAALVLASVAWFHMGALVFGRGRAAGVAGPPSPDPGLRGFRAVGMLYLAVGVPAAMVTLVKGVQLAAAEGYLALYRQTQLTGWENWQAVVAGFAVPGVLILAATSVRRRTIVTAWIVTVAYALLTLLTGARAAAAMALLPMLLVQHRAVKALRPAVGIALAVLALVGLPLVAALRDLSAADRAEAVRSEPRTGSPATALVKEMGNSMQTVALTLDLVPVERPLEYGAGYLRALTTVVPNLFWDTHPFAAEGSYSQWLVWRVEPFTASLGGGIGYSMIAEAYVNGGLVGALAIMLVAGSLLAAAVARTRARRDGIAIATEALLLGALLALPRGESSDIARPLMWNVVLPLVAAAVARAGALVRGAAAEGP